VCCATNAAVRCPTTASHFEQSTCYQRYTADTFLAMLILSAARACRRRAT
jgi:hypothetical protein